MTTSWSYTGIFFLMCIFPPWQKLFSLEMFQQYTANILPLWNSAGKFCNLKKHLGHLTGVSMDLQTRDQKKKKKKTHKVNCFDLAPKELGDVYDWAYCYSVARACPTLCNPMGCSTPDFPVLHSLPEFAQTHVHCDWPCLQLFTGEVRTLHSHPSGLGVKDMRVKCTQSLTQE